MPKVKATTFLPRFATFRAAGTRARLTLALIAALLLGLYPGLGHAASFQISGLDQHDGDLVQVGNTYYLYGTSYGCGWSWMANTKPWCGFEVRTSTDMQNWSAPQLLFDPGNSDTYSGNTWAYDCSYYGCFRPRMLQRPDGVWILWFNDVRDYREHHWNGYYTMGCAGPAGPCGAGSKDVSSSPVLSTHKPSMWLAWETGDFGIAVQYNSAYLVATGPGQQLAIERLDPWWTNGTGIGIGYGLAGLRNVEAPGPYYDGQHWRITYSNPNCAYCTGTGTGELVSEGDMLGPWEPAGTLSANSCGGQPNLVVSVGGQQYEWIDQWTGYPNETSAPIYLAPPQSIPC